MNDSSTKGSSADMKAEAARHYEEFFGPLYFEPYAIEVARRIEPAKVSIALEIAAGTGRVTRHLRERLSASTKLIASDISDDMLAVAKKELSDLEINWQKIDAQELPFGDESIDLVVCCFGYMFVPDKPKAFAEAYRILKPGGLFLFTTWDELKNNAPSYVSRSITEKYLDQPLREPYNPATSMSDEAVISRLLSDAGFSEISIEKIGLFAVSPTAKEAAYGLVEWGPLAEMIREKNAAWMEEIKIKVEEELAAKYGTAPMVAPISAVISEARK